MIKLSFYLYNSAKKAYLTIDKTARASLTTDIRKAKQFEEQKAMNYLNNQLRLDRGDYKMIPVDPAQVQTFMPNEKGLGDQIVPLGENQWVRKALDELVEQLSKLDLQLSDLYHYAYLHPNLPAHKGYKLYRILSKVAGRRAEVKIQLNALQNCVGVRKPYNPRTELYEKLSEL